MRAPYPHNLNSQTCWCAPTLFKWDPFDVHFGADMMDDEQGMAEAIADLDPEDHDLLIHYEPSFMRMAHYPRPRHTVYHEYRD